MSYLALLCALLTGVIIGSLASFAAGFEKGHRIGFEEFRTRVENSCDAVLATCDRQGATFADLMQSVRMLAESLRSDGAE